MTKRILLGGVVGAVLVFLVSFIWHMVTGLGEVGVQSLPGDGAIQTAMRASIHEPGLYFFPPMANQKGLSKAEAAAEQEKYLASWEQGPTGILVYSPGGVPLQFGKLLLNQFIFGLVAALLIAWILAIAAGATTFGSRALIVLLIAVASGVIWALPYWNWYNFPMNFTIVNMANWIVSWGIAGLGMAAVVKR